MRIHAVATLLGLIAALGVPVRAQSLADVAKKEADRRSVVKGSGKVYTNTDLKAVPAPPADTSGQASADATGGSGTSVDTAAADPTTTDPTTTDATAADAQSETDTDAGKADDKSEVKDEAYWRDRKEMLSAALERDQLLSEALQSRINALTADFAGRDDAAQRDKIGVNRVKALAELDRMKQVVAADAKAIAAFEEEARRAGVPPGWLR